MNDLQRQTKIDLNFKGLLNGDPDVIDFVDNTLIDSDEERGDLHSRYLAMRDFVLEGENFPSRRADILWRQLCLIKQCQSSFKDDAELTFYRKMLTADLALEYSKERNESRHSWWLPRGSMYDVIKWDESFREELQHEFLDEAHPFHFNAEERDLVRSQVFTNRL